MRKFSPEMDMYIRDNIHKPYKEITEGMNLFFGLNFTETQVRSRADYINCHRNVDTRFKKGGTPYNKGKTTPQETRDKISQSLKGNLPAATKPLLSEIVVKGYTYIKVDMPNVWKLKHHLIWEKEKGKIPDGHLIIFVDKDKTNFDIDNLRCVSKADLAVLNHQYKDVNDPKLRDICINVSKIKTKISKKEHYI